MLNKDRGENKLPGVYESIGQLYQRSRPEIEPLSLIEDKLVRTLSNFECQVITGSKYNNENLNFKILSELDICGETY